MPEMSMGIAVFYNSRLNSMRGSGSRHDCEKCGERKGRKIKTRRERKRRSVQDEESVDVCRVLMNVYAIAPTSFLA